MSDTFFPRGKKAATPSERDFRFSDVFNQEALPVPPAVFGRRGLVKNYFMLGNDQYGNCVECAAAHRHMLWTVEGGGPRMPITPFDVLSDYSDITGFHRGNPFSDQGTDMGAAAAYWRKTGLLDAKGNRHKVDGYVALEVGNVDQLALAVWLTGAVDIGLWLPNDADEQFMAGQPWSVTGASQSGGHAVCVIDRAANGNFIVVTWGREQEMTPEYYQKFNDEAIVYISVERLKNKVSPEGFSIPAMQTLLARVSKPMA